MPRDYASEILSGEFEQKKARGRDYAKEILSGEIEDLEPVGGTFVPTGEISTITAKPVTRFAPRSTEEAGFGARMKSVFADDPVTKVKIFAAARGISPTRYRLGKSGQLEFRTEEGKWEREVSDLPVEKLKSLAADVLGHPSTYLGTAGAAMGPVGAGAGMAAGELIRKGVAKKVYGEEIRPASDLLDVFLQGVIGLGSAAAGKAVGAGINKALSRRAGILTKAGEEARLAALSPQEHARAAWLEGIADKFDIQLAPHQLYDREGLINTWKYLRKHPSTADEIGKFEKAMDESTDEAIHKFIYDMRGFSREPSAVGSDLKRTAEQAITGKETARTKTVSPLYEKAFAEAKPVDLRLTLRNLDRLIESYPEGNVQRGLLGVKKMLTTWAEPGKTPRLEEAVSHKQVPQVSPKAGALVPTAEEAAESSGMARIRIPESDLRKIQKTLFDLDDLIEGTSYEAGKIAPSSKKVLNRELTLLKEDILTAAEKASPGFIEANKVFADLSPPIEKLKKSVIGELSRMQKDTGIARAPRKLLDMENMPDAALLRSARDEIKRQDPGLWRETVGQYIRDEYERLLVTEEGNVANAAGKLYKHLFGNTRRRNIMEAAMDVKDLKVFEDLMTVFQRAAVGRGKESMTAPFLQYEKRLGGQMGSNVYALLSQPKQTIVEWTLGKWNDMLLAGRQQELFEALTSKEAVERLAKIKRLTPGSERLIQEMAVLTGMVVDRQARMNEGE